MFYAWSSFPDLELGEATLEHPHPPCSRIDAMMTFSYYGLFVRIPHLFTWDRYVWQPVCRRYEGIGPVEHHISA